MAPRRKIENTSMESRYHWDKNNQDSARRDRFMYKGEFQYAQKSERYSRRNERRYNLNGEYANRTCHTEELKKDLAATKLVWKMILSGSERMLNKIFRSA